MSTEQNKSLVRRWFAEIDRGNIDAVDELLAADYVDHNPAIPGLPSGREGVRRANRLLQAAFSDPVHTIEEQLAEGDKVMTHVTTRARFTGEFLGFPPTGEVIEIRGIAVHRVRDGKLVEHWAHADMLSFMQRIGAVTSTTDTPPG